MAKTKTKKFLEKILVKLYFWKAAITRNPMRANHDIFDKFVEFNSKLSHQTGTKLEPQFDLRCREIFDIVEKFGVKHVVELGTGRTTFVFNVIPNVKCVSVEQDPLWLTTIKAIFAEIKIDAEIVGASVYEYKQGARFDDLPPGRPCLLYIDAPYIRREDGKKKFDTFSGKPAYYDFETYIERGLLPRVIMIEGRTDTADAILSSKISKSYRFFGEFSFCIQRKKYFSCMRLLRHSVFIFVGDENTNHKPIEDNENIVKAAQIGPLGIFG